MSGWTNPQSAENGRQFGGRPKSTATLVTQKSREFTTQWVAERLEETLGLLWTEASKGNIIAIKELLERGLGKSSAILGDDDQELIRAVALKFIECGHNTRSTTTSETTDIV